MEETTLSYSEIVKHFGGDVIRDRYRYLHDKMQMYIKERSLSDCLSVNESILHQTVMDYFADVYRLKTFHKIQNINKAKIVAYEVYWLWRRKPIQLKVPLMDTDDTKRNLVFVNEGFLTTLICSEFLMPKETEPLSTEAEDTFFTFLEHLHYYFKYRPVDKQNLELILCAFNAGDTLHNNG